MKKKKSNKHIEKYRDLNSKLGNCESCETCQAPINTCQPPLQHRSLNVMQQCQYVLCVETHTTPASLSSLLCGQHEPINLT